VVVDSVPKIWHVLNHLSLAILLYDNRSHTFSANAAAQSLFQLNRYERLNKSHFKHITLHTAAENKPLTLTALFASKKSIKLQLHAQPDVIGLNSVFSQIDDHISLCAFEYLQSSTPEDYNFDRVISEISTDLIDIQNDDIEQHINFALKAIATVCKADRGYLFEFNVDDETITNTYEWVKQGIAAYKDELQAVPKAALPYFFEEMNATHLFQVNDVAQLPKAAAAEQAEFQRQNIQSVLCIGIRFGKELVGFIGCDCVYTKRAWTDSDLIRIKLVGEIITNALKNIDYKKKLQLAQQQLITANQKLSELVDTDGLTNIANRRCFDKTLKSEIQRCARLNQPISLIMCDIDFFKRYNDTYGHQQGDETLKKVATALSQLCRREGDLAARYGGEEFAIILPDVDSQHCQQFSQLLQQKIAQLQIAHGNSDVANILTLSIGFYSLYPAHDANLETIIKNADTALYQAKETGRNRVCQFRSE
jgi:diguanylate cyclase (GGDEF)-like protein